MVYKPARHPHPLTFGSFFSSLLDPTRYIRRMAQPARPPIRFGSVRLMRDAPIGTGAYGQVFRATLDELPCAAKLLHAILLDPERPRNRTLFEQECRFLSEIRHPNIVQYLGVAEDEVSGLPILLMELMDDSLTHFLEQSDEPLAYHVQVNIGHDIALAVAFLHLNHIVHRDLSSSNVLLIGAGSRAKVTDFGMSTLTELNPRMTGLTKCPGNPAYMSPEALLDPPVYTEKLDCFQVGVLMLQIMTRKYPVPGRAMNRVRDTRYPTGWANIPVPELQRRHNHLSLVAETHPMLPLAKDCLKDMDTERPSAQQICRRLSALKEAPQYAQSLKDTDTERPSAQQICRRLSALKEAPQYAQSLEGRGGEREGGERVVLGEGGREGREREGEAQEREELIRQLREENQARQAREREVREKEREVENIRDEVRVKEGENETLRGVVGEREREVREKEREVRGKEREVREKEREVREKERVVENLRGEVRVKERDIETLRGVVQEREREVREREREVMVKNEENQRLRLLVHDRDQTIHQRQQTQQFAPSYTCLVSGPGLQSATANHPTRVVVDLSDSSGRPCSLKQNVTAELVRQSTSSQATPSSHARQPSDTVAVISPSRYEVSYTAVRRGPHKLHVRVNGSEINGSPFTMTVYPDPTQLGSPMRVVKDLNYPYGIVSNSRGEMIVNEFGGHQVSVFDVGGRRIRTFGSCGGRPEQMKSPAGIAVDDTDNIYVSSEHKLQKFTSSGELIKCIGRRGSKEGEFYDPRGVTIHSNQVYVCDSDNDRIQVFDLDLNFIRSIGSRGSGRGEFDRPRDVVFDTTGNMYAVEYDNNRVQVMDSSGQFLRMFSQEGEGKLSEPTALHIADKYVYVSDCSNHRIAVYETSGQYVTSFGRRGEGEGEFRYPYCITSCVSGCIYVCDGCQQSSTSVLS